MMESKHSHLIAFGAHELLEQQKSDWSLCGNNYSDLSTIETKNFDFDGFSLHVQFNPGRLISTSAKVDSKSIEERKCFLCSANRPVEQRDIAFGEDYLVLVNPFPIFPEHFTLTHRLHIPQNIDQNFGSLLEITKALGDRYTVFYNGPGCGASAPDHQHFQAGTKFFMPIDKEITLIMNKYKLGVIELSKASLTSVDDGLRKMIILTGTDPEELKKLFHAVNTVRLGMEKINHEPMMNVVSTYSFEYERWQIIIFLRKKHRPDRYFAEDGSKILLSPASVDIGGVCITPRKEDFDIITSLILQEILREVFVEKEYLDELLTRLNQNFQN